MSCVAFRRKKDGGTEEPERRGCKRSQKEEGSGEALSARYKLRQLLFNVLNTKSFKRERWQMMKENKRLKRVSGSVWPLKLSTAISVKIILMNNPPSCQW